MPDLVYNRPANRKKYISSAKHQANAQNPFSKWINMNVERNIFDFADYGNFQKLDNHISWTCTSGNMYGLNQNRDEVGTERQQFGFFQKPSNVDGEWHGFPIIPFSQDRYNISDALLDRWVNEGVLNVDDVPNIMKKKRI